MLRLIESVLLKFKYFIHARCCSIRKVYLPICLNFCHLTLGKQEKMFTLKKWNAVAMWSWDVECDTCAICRVQVSTHEQILNLIFQF